METALTSASLKEYLQLHAAREQDLDEVVAAVISLITSYHGAPESWPDHVKLGAKMLAARVYRRRNSPAGVESMGELGPVYVSRNDPDLAQLLKIGRYSQPRVG